MKRQQPEYVQQCTVVQWARLQARAYPVLDLLYAIPNAGKLPVQYRVKLKRQGLVAGMPDLCLPCPGKGGGALFIEMKAKKGRISLDQTIVLGSLLSYGNRVEVCYSADHAIWVIRDYLGMKEGV